MGEEKDRALVRDFVEWSWRNHLNMDKTRDMVMDFRKERTATQLLSILGGVMEAVEDSKYLGVHMDSRLKWKTNTEAVGPFLPGWCCNNSVYHLRLTEKLRSSCPDMLSVRTLKLHMFSCRTLFCACLVHELGEHTTQTSIKSICLIFRVLSTAWTPRQRTCLIYETLTSWWARTT